MPKMTKQHFKLIAEILSDAKESLDISTHRFMVHEFARGLISTNRMFDYDKFIRAAGLDD